jgi:rhamnulokinase
MAAATGLGDVTVIATCSHDTAAAVAAVPATSTGDWAFLSSGTWSLIGVELPAPLINESVRAQNFSNEAGFGGTTCFLQSLAGLWILQECRRTWAQSGQALDYAALAAEAAAAEPFRALLRPDDPRFQKPGDMPARIAAYCRETGQRSPETPGQFTRCIYESLALLYRKCLASLEELTGRPLTRLHIVGGGSQSRLLNQFAANATGRTVLAGPVEATALGNVLIQAIALGHLGSLEELRRTVAASFPIEEFVPADEPAWDAAFTRFNTLPLA